MSNRKVIFKKNYSTPNDMNNENETPKPAKINNYTILKMLGKGAYGKVYLVRHTSTDELFAMKVLGKKEQFERNRAKMSTREVQTMKLINSSFVVKLVSTFHDDKKLYIVMENVTGGNFRDLIKIFPDLNEYEIKFLLAELHVGIEYLHTKNIVHRDLKMENLLFTNEGHLKICDLGLAKAGVTRDTTCYTLCGTPAYMAPEMLMGVGYGQSIDWWSFGLIIFEMFGTKNPFRKADKKEMRRAIRLASIENESRGRLTDAAWDLASRILTLKSDRIESDEIAMHPLFVGIEWEAIKEQRVEPPFIFGMSNTIVSNQPIEMDSFPVHVLDAEETDPFVGFSYNNDLF